MASPEPIALVSTWTVSDEDADELERLGRQAIAAAARFPGHLDGTILREAGSSEIHIVHSFTTPEALRRWSDSPERDACTEALARIAERRGGPQRVTGLEGWFVAHRGATSTIKPPPRWKMWLASFLGAYPLVVLFQWLVAPDLEEVPLLLRAALLPLVLLSLMTYLMMPLVTRLLHGWLYPQGEHRS